MASRHWGMRVFGNVPCSEAVALHGGSSLSRCYFISFKQAVGPRNQVQPYTPPVRKALRGGEHLRGGFSLASALAALLLATLAPSAVAEDAYVVNFGKNSVSVIDTLTNRVVGAPIKVGNVPDGIAIAPDGRKAYVAKQGAGNLSVIDTLTNRVLGSPIGFGDPSTPAGIAITPDGRRAYVADDYYGVWVIDTKPYRLNDLIDVGGSGEDAGMGASAIAISPDGRRAYVVRHGAADVPVIDTQTNRVIGSLTDPGDPSAPQGIAISPDGRTAYVTNLNSTVSVFDTQTNQVVGSPIELGVEVFPAAIAITPDGRRAYVAGDPHNVSVIDTQTNQVVSAPISVGGHPDSIALTPDGKRVYVANQYSNNVSVIDTKTNRVVGSPIKVGVEPWAIAIAPHRRTGNPGVLVMCPKGARPGGCKFKLQAVTKERRGNAESAVARVKLRAGRSAVVSLKPKKGYRAKLGAATKILVKETLAINGSKRTLFRRLKVVQ